MEKEALLTLSDRYLSDFKITDAGTGNNLYTPKKDVLHLFDKDYIQYRKEALIKFSNEKFSFLKIETNKDEVIFNVYTDEQCFNDFFEEFLMLMSLDSFLLKHRIIIHRK